MPGNDCRLNLSGAVEHVSQDLLQARERGFPGDVVSGPNLFGRNQTECPANRFRRVMECRLQRDL